MPAGAAARFSLNGVAASLVLITLASGMVRLSAATSARQRQPDVGDLVVRFPNTGRALSYPAGNEASQSIR